MALLLGLDVGTSGTKAVVIDEAGRVIRQAHASYPVSSPRPLWSEQDPDDWVVAARLCLSELSDLRIDAMGLTGQMHGSVFLSKSDQVLRPAMLWNDQRTVAECQEIEEKVGRDLIREVTGNPPLTGFQLPKILWLKNHEPTLFEKLHRVLLPKDYVRFRLTGEICTDVSDASGVGALDLKKRKWDADILSRLGLDPIIFPEVIESDEVCANWQGVPVVAGGGDQAAGAVGTGAVLPQIISLSLGSSGVVFSPLDSVPLRQLDPIHNFCHANRAWHAMGVTLNCGSAVRWFRDSLSNGRTYDEITDIARQAAPGSGGLLFAPYLSGERCPYVQPHARAGFIGATTSSGLPEFCRAVFEGVNFALKDALSALVEVGVTPGPVRVTGGGAKSGFWLQALADILELECVTLEADEGPAFGAALLAGVGTGVWSSVQEACNETVRTQKSYVPGKADYSSFYRDYQVASEAVRQLRSAQIG